MPGQLVERYVGWPWTAGMGLDENADAGKDHCMWEQEFGREGVTDTLAPALVGQGTQVATQEDLAELVRQGEAVTRRLVAPQTLLDGGVSFTMLKHRAAQYARRQGKVVERRAQIVG